MNNEQIKIKDTVYSDLGLLSAKESAEYLKIKVETFYLKKIKPDQVIDGEHFYTKQTLQQYVLSRAKQDNNKPTQAISSS